MTPASIAFGIGSSPTRASVTTPSVPSDPQIKSIQSIPGRSRYPAVFFVTFGSGIVPGSKSIASPRPNSRTVPSANATRSRSIHRRVAPYFKLRDPLALVAIFPPIAAPVSVGSGG
jgi:hypothetical protein